MDKKLQKFISLIEKYNGTSKSYELVKSKMLKARNLLMFHQSFEKASPEDQYDIASTVVLIATQTSHFDILRITERYTYEEPKEKLEFALQTNTQL